MTLHIPPSQKKEKRILHGTLPELNLGGFQYGRTIAL